MNTADPSRQTVILGAGLAGLTAARVLHSQGQSVLVLDASDGVGGRLRTDLVDGFTLDRGFQVLFDNYPTAHKLLDLPALEPRFFDSGALLHDDGDFHRLLHPIRHPDWLLSDLLSPAFSFGDKIALASLAASCALHSDASILSRRGHAHNESSTALLRRLGISDEMIACFIRPFFGGVFLDDSLETDATLLRYYFRKFVLGRVFIPANGIAAIPHQLAAPLPGGSIRLHTRAESLEFTGDRVTAIRTESGEVVPCGSVVLATPEPEAARLLGVPIAPRAARSVTTVYFKLLRSLYTGALLVLPRFRADRLVLHMLQVTNVVPEAAPDGWQLLSATVLHPGDLDDSTLAERVAAEIVEIFSEATGALEPLSVVRVPYAQFSQHPGEFSPLATATLPANLVLAGDHTANASIESAMASGEAAAIRLNG